MHYIIAFIIAIAILGALLEFIKELLGGLFGWIGRHLSQIILVILFLGLCSQVGVATTVVLYAIGALVYTLWKNLKHWIARNNERALTQHLNQNCLRFGYMNHDSWTRALPDYANKTYPESTSFYCIVDQFASDVERQYIASDEKLSWLDPAIRHLAQEMADVHQLAQVPSEGLHYTHSTPNEKLIYDAMENLCACKKIGNKAMIQKVPLEEDAVRKDLGLRDSAAIPEYYKAAYIISDELRNKRKDGCENAVESEEFTFDDL